MHIITRKRIKEAQAEHTEASSALAGWYRTMLKSDFADYASLKRTFGSVDKVGDKYVFDIGGNKLRLIASIHFDRKKVFIRAILTHPEYDRGQWKK